MDVFIVTLSVTLEKKDTQRTASTPFFSTLRAIGRIRYYRIRAPDHPPQTSVKAEVFLLSGR